MTLALTLAPGDYDRRIRRQTNATAPRICASDLPRHRPPLVQERARQPHRRHDFLRADGREPRAILADAAVVVQDRVLAAPHDDARAVPVVHPRRAHERGARGERAARKEGATRAREDAWGRATARTSADSFGVAGAAALCFADFFLRRSGLGPPAFARDAIAGAPESAPRGGLFVPFSC